MKTSKINPLRKTEPPFNHNNYMTVTYKYDGELYSDTLLVSEIDTEAPIIKDVVEVQYKGKTIKATTKDNIRVLILDEKHRLDRLDFLLHNHAERLKENPHSENLIQDLSDGLQMYVSGAMSENSNAFDCAFLCTVLDVISQASQVKKTKRF